MDKSDFDYTSKMIAELNGVTSRLVDPIVQYPSMGDEKYCSDCIHWVKEHKTHGQLYCELQLQRSAYCISHGKPYWKHKNTWIGSTPKPKPFLTEEDMEIE